MPYYTNASKEVQDQNFSPSDFEEMQFVEQIASNRAALLQKVPLILFCGMTLWYGRRLRFSHDNLVTRLSYVRVGAPKNP